MALKSYPGPGFQTTGALCVLLSVVLLVYMCGWEEDSACLGGFETWNGSMFWGKGIFTISDDFNCDK